MKKLSLSDRAVYFSFTIIPVALYSIFYVFQVLGGMFYSLTDWNGMAKTYSIIGLKNYILLLQNPNFWRSLGTTFRYSVLLVIFTLVLSMILALALDSLKKRAQTVAKSIFFIPAMLSAVTVALIWSQIYYRAIPIIGETLHIGVLKASPLADPKTTLFATVFVNVWQSVAIPSLIFIAGLQSISRELYESAMIDSASILQRFRYIILPHLMPTMVVNLVLLVKNGFTTFDYPYALTQGGPARATEVIAITIVNDAFRDYRFSIANAEAVILFIIIASISFVQIWLTSKGDAYK
ncbi:MAG: sugar ABC transporter permease [Treponema sp.]|jgi:raffinose/stachyose/melibiose transport system permease protein|nr:sugar ABC transporter permease [Treponema sp.]